MPSWRRISDYHPSGLVKQQRFAVGFTVKKWYQNQRATAITESVIVARGPTGNNATFPEEFASGQKAFVTLRAAKHPSHLQNVTLLPKITQNSGHCFHFLIECA
jgi:hypothetical protein